MIARRVQLGCGDQKRADWINVDNDPQWRPDVLRDITKGLPFDDLSVDEVFSKNTLEHLDSDGLLYCLFEVQRVLKTGGKAVFIVPLGIVPDLSHKSFFHKFSFENLLQQKYRFGIQMIVEEKVVKHNPEPFDYDELEITLVKE